MVREGVGKSTGEAEDWEGLRYCCCLKLIIYLNFKYYYYYYIIINIID